MTLASPNRRLMRITRRQFTAAAGAAALAGSLAAPNIGRTEELPHLLMIAIDDQNNWASSSRGYPLFKNGLPFDATAEQRALADMGYAARVGISPLPYCAGAREAAIRGKHPHTTGVYGFGQGWMTSKTIGPLVKGGPAQQKGIFQFFREQGYFTIGCGKVPHDGWKGNDGAKERYKLEPWSFDIYQNCGGGECYAPKTKGEGTFPFHSIGPDFADRPDTKRVDWLIEHVLNKIGTFGKPVFASIGLQDPHLPWDPPEEFWRALGPEEGVLNIPYPLGVKVEDQRSDITMETSADLRDLPPEALAFIRQYGEQDSLGNNKAEGIIRSGQWKQYIRAYLAEMMSTDRNIGRLRAAIPANTIVVMWSDHGWMLGEKMGWRKYALWEAALGVPLVFAGPGISVGRSDNPISLTDLFATLTGFVFGEVPTKADLGKYDLDGQDRSAWLRGDPTQRHESAVLSEWPRIGAEPADGLRANPIEDSFTIRTNDFRLIDYANGDRELYAHSGPRNDPYEFNNLLYEGRPADVAKADELAALLPDRSKIAPPARTGEPDDDE